MVIRFIEGRDRETCDGCGFIWYRNPLPAVGVVVAIEGRIVLVRRRFEPQAGSWALPAGYMELGETPEQAAARECLEETGLTVQVEHLLGVYAFGNTAQSGILLIFAAKALAGTLEALDDALEIGTFSPEHLPEPFAFSTHRSAIERWYATFRQTIWPDLPREPFDFALRYAESGDAEHVLDLCLPRAQAAQRITALANFTHSLIDPHYQIVIAERDQHILGVACIRIVQQMHGLVAYVEELHIAPKVYDDTVYAALLDQVTLIAQARACRILYIINASVQDTTTQEISRKLQQQPVWVLPLARSDCEESRI
jgi:ADP-ribose pyrophosphatase YjhB (NUDIX family)